MVPEETQRESAHIERLLTPLRESIIDKPPYISGKLQLKDSYFSLLYRLPKDSHAARHINLANATADELEQLTQACDPASFVVNKEDVLDETYCKAGKMDSDRFAPLLNPVHTDLLKIIRDYLLEGGQSKNSIKVEPYKLNVYDKGSFFKPHVDTPRSEKMFGSLVIVFPTPHEGGALLLRHRGHEWSFDSGKELAAEHQPTIGYVAFLRDIEHEVAPVVSGHRVTLTYNLYFDDDGPIPAIGTASDNRFPPLARASNEHSFREAFNSLLANPEFLADGGTLAFGLRNVYPIKKSLEHVYSILKGSDAVVYESVRALGFQPVLYVYYEDEDEYRGALIQEILDFSWVMIGDDGNMINIVCREGGIGVHQRGWEPHVDDDDDDDDEMMLKETVEWVTPITTTFNRKGGAYATLENLIEPVLNVAYGDVCLVVRIGGAGDRLAYPRASLKDPGDDEDDEEDDDDDDDDDSPPDDSPPDVRDSPPTDIGRGGFKHGRGCRKNAKRKTGVWGPQNMYFPLVLRMMGIQ